MQKCVVIVLVPVTLDWLLNFTLTKDIVTSAAETHIAPAGTANQGRTAIQGGPDRIYSYAFDKTQRLVTDARGHLLAKGDVTRTREVIAEHAGGGEMNTDASGCMISTTGNTNSSVHVKVVSGTPPKDWKPFFS